MPTFEEKAKDFLAYKNLAVAGVSRNEVQTANGIYKMLRSRGYQVYPVNPNAEEVEGDKCYPNLKSLPEGEIDWLLIVTRPERSLQLVQECADSGIPRVWMHGNAFMGESGSSVSQEAVEFCQDNGITVIAGGCPLMFLEIGHKCMRWIMGLMGNLPE
jgi:predicted CoA-binding protein